MLRMEDAFFQYAALRVSQWYPEDIEPISVKLHSSTSETLEKITTVYHGAFMTKYAGKSNTIILHLCCTDGKTTTTLLKWPPVIEKPVLVITLLGCIATSLCNLHNPIIMLAAH